MPRRTCDFTQEELDRIEMLKRRYEWKTDIQVLRESLKIAEKVAPPPKIISGTPPESLRRG